MNDIFRAHIHPVDGKDTSVYTGFGCEHVKVHDITTGDTLEWFRLAGATSGISRDVSVPDFTILSSGANSDGITMVKFGTDDMSELSSDPTAVDMNNYHEADGFMIDAAWSELADSSVYLVEAWPVITPCYKIVHDGGDNSNTFCQDASYDFADLGVSTGWIVYNQTNQDYAYVKEVLKPSGKSKYCRLTLAINRSGETATSAADVDDDDVLYIMPYPLQYPMSDIGLMS